MSSERNNHLDGSVRRWRRHPAYKASGVPWSPETPSHWKMCRLKDVATVRPSNVDKKTVEGEKAVRLCNYVDVYKNDYITDALDFMPATATASQIETFALRTGDVIITKDSESWDDIAVPAYVPGTLEGVVCGYHLAMVRANQKKINGEYLFRCFMAVGICDQYRIAANGITRFGLGSEAITEALFPIPPLGEQRSIAAFLAAETVKIDTLVAKKQRLIQLLQEKRSALISHAVTRGVVSNEAKKDSGVAWLGQIPAHWQLRKIGTFSRVGNGSTPLRENMEYWNDGVFPWLNSAVVNNAVVGEPPRYVSNLALAECHLPVVRPGCILVAITGEGKTRGKAALLNYEATISQHLAYIQPMPGVVNGRFVRYSLDSAYDMLRLLSDGAGSTKTARSG